MEMARPILASLAFAILLAAKVQGLAGGGEFQDGLMIDDTTAAFGEWDNTDVEGSDECCKVCEAINKDYTAFIFSVTVSHCACFSPKDGVQVATKVPNQEESAWIPHPISGLCGAPEVDVEPKAMAMAVQNVESAPANNVLCSGGATLLSTSPELDMVLCKDEAQQTCESDFGTLCPAGWNLCTPGQFNNRNNGWDYNWVEAKAGNPLGVIYCYMGDRAAHYGILSYVPPVLNTGVPLNCWAGSSRPGCENFARNRRDCNDKENSALCCAPTRTCGDGLVQLEEDCDDGNDSNMDDCLNTCTWKKPGRHGILLC